MRRWLNKLLRGTPVEPGPAELAGGERIDEWLREAYGLHRSGRSGEAEDRYRRILRAQPGNVDALYLLGEIANRSGRHALAIELIGKAIAANDKVAVFHHELGTARRANGDLTGAEQSFARAIELAPEDLQSRNELGDLQLVLGKVGDAEQSFREIQRLAPELLTASVNLGSALMAQNRLDEAIENLNEALRLDPFCVQALSNLGAIAIKRNDIPGAQRLLERALEFDPLCYEARVNLAVVFQKQNLWDKALRILEEAARIRPGDPHAKYVIGRVHWQRGDYGAAEQSLREALSRAPDLIDAGIDLGKILYETGRAQEALAQMRSVLEQHPEKPVAHVSLGFALETMGEFAQAMHCYDKALALDPGCVQAHVNRGVLWILTGDFDRGWPEYEWRVSTEELVEAYQRFALPRWDGSPLAGRCILVHAEQGLGDEIMYASCFPEVIAQAKQCVIECADKLVPLFARSFPQAVVRGMARGNAAQWLKEAPPIDVQIPAASLPLYLRRDAADFPRDRPYIEADPARVARWRARLAEVPGKLRIGLSWRGGVALTGNALRSMPLERLLPVLQQQGIAFVSLQYGKAQDEVNRVAERHGISILHWQEAIDDYEETAALMCALDLTISVCTAVVHLGGALGRPVWAMAPLRPEARYGISGETMPWYGSVRMFRQPRYGDWDSVIANVTRELGARAAGPVLRSSTAAVTVAQ